MFWLYLLGVCLRVELLGHVIAMFSFPRSCQVVFQSSRTISHSHEECRFQFLHILTYICFYILYFSHPSEWKVTFICISVMLVMFFLCFLAIMYLFWRNVYPSPLLTFELFFFRCWVVRLLYIFWIEIPYQQPWFVNVFIYSLVVFLLSWWCLLKGKSFNFNEV